LNLRATESKKHLVIKKRKGELLNTYFLINNKKDLIAIEKILEDAGMETLNVPYKSDIKRVNIEKYPSWCRNVCETTCNIKDICNCRKFKCL
jgi:hypothetical protein